MTKQKKEHDGEDPVEQYNFSKRIAEAADKSAFKTKYTPEVHTEK